MDAAISLHYPSAMSIESTLKKVEADISAGDLGHARQRMHGLIATYPERLDLRPRLAEIYWQLEYPAMAGRYWYLVEANQPHQRQAVARFEAEFGQDPLRILQALKLRADPETVDDLYARERLQTLYREVRKKHSLTVDYTPEGKLVSRPTRRSIWGWRLLLTGCMVIVLVIFGLALFGLINLIAMIF